MVVVECHMMWDGLLGSHGWLEHTVPGSSLIPRAEPMTSTSWGLHKHVLDFHKLCLTLTLHLHLCICGRPHLSWEKATQNQKLGDKLYKVWVDLTGSDFPGHPKGSLLFPSPLRPLHTTLRENQLNLHLWILEDLEHELQDDLPLHCGSFMSSVRALLPVDTCLILQITLMDSLLAWPLALNLADSLTLQLWLD